MPKFLDILALTAYCGLIYWLSDQPSIPLPMLFEYQDKLHHFAAYFVMAFLARRSFKHFVRSPVTLVIISLAFCSLYGVSDEWHQSFVEGRTADSLDWLADTIGSAIAVLLMTL